MTLAVGVLASGAGTNLQAILDRLHGRGEVEVVAVGSNAPDAPALGRAAALGIETEAFVLGAHADRGARDAAMGGSSLPSLPAFTSPAILSAVPLGASFFCA